MNAEAPAAVADRRWAKAWPDAVAFAGGLAVVWFAGWQTTDLVWSLWLSSLVVGYAVIVWSIFGPMVFIGGKVWQGRADLPADAVAPAAIGGTIFLVGGLFMLAFFTVHFGMFHYVHSVFLNSFFPVDPSSAAKSSPGPALYWLVLQRYGWFLPVAVIAERAAFRLAPVEPKAPDVSVKAADIAARKARNARAGAGFQGMMAPYRNVVRLHLLIFFFAFAHFARLENFFVYAVVYAVYFFPWRLLRGEKRAETGAAQP
ncbi:MAG: hypothetical protein EXS43_05470 [Opitutus sp.]|nr:hypothetical protein [Opitutus sp.]